MTRSTPLEPVTSLTEENEPPKTLAEAVYRRFRQDILWGRLPPGSPLRSNELSQAYEVGISPLREALSRLLSEKLVTLSGQRGFRVAPLTFEDVLDTMEARVVIECEALTRSIQHGGLLWETEVVSNYHALSRIELPEGPGEQAEKWAEHHRKFHMALISGCRSPWLQTLAKTLFDHAERHRIIALRQLCEQRDAGNEHQLIMKAALAGNIKAAVATLDHHYRTTADLVAASVFTEERSSDTDGS